MSVKKMDGEIVRAEWRAWVEQAGAGQVDVVIVVEGKETAALIAYRDYLALRDELIRLRADRKQTLDELAIAAGLANLAWIERIHDEDTDEDSGDGGSGDGE